MKNNNILFTNTQLQQSQTAELSLLDEHELNEVTGGEKKEYSWYCFTIGCRNKDRECDCPPDYY